ncbi:unnamed protein product [Soboliphyme baturini]|uniref:Uncharacterized protein n=1 Tax=Soboliphyme baturini TaxID=241478 RepID=A0A183II19_9BILA|nr:unnamed protein product [Soboliphyme baturini]
MRLRCTCRPRPIVCLHPHATVTQTQVTIDRGVLTQVWWRRCSLLRTNRRRPDRQLIHLSPVAQHLLLLYVDCVLKHDGITSDEDSVGFGRDERTSDIATSIIMGRRGNTFAMFRSSWEGGGRGRGRVAVWRPVQDQRNCLIIICTSDYLQTRQRQCSPFEIQILCVEVVRE